VLVRSRFPGFKLVAGDQTRLPRPIRLVLFYAMPLDHSVGSDAIGSERGAAEEAAVAAQCKAVSVGFMSHTGFAAGAAMAARRRTIVLIAVRCMQQDGRISFEPVAQTSSLRAWHVMVAVFLFACVIYGVVWWARKRSESNPGSLRVRGNHPNSGGRS
jgi:hypothetical protein